MQKGPATGISFRDSDAPHLSAVYYQWLNGRKPAWGGDIFALLLHDNSCYVGHRPISYHDGDDGCMCQPFREQDDALFTELREGTGGRRITGLLLVTGRSLRQMSKSYTKIAQYGKICVLHLQGSNCVKLCTARIFWGAILCYRSDLGFW